jgi:hypothetical protein
MDEDKKEVMKHITKSALLILALISGCSTTGRVHTENFPVESFSKDDIFIFVKKNEYRNPNAEIEVNNLIRSCSKALSSEDYKVYSKVLREDESGDYLTKGAILVTVWDEQLDAPAGGFEKNLYLKFERISKKNRYILPIHGLKATLVDDMPFSVENIELMCSKAIKSIKFDE